MDQLIEKGLFMNESDFLKAAVRELIRKIEVKATA
jgi:Arc/MetJ-type ribon-helix-helix transcriptional regulator